MPFCYLLILTPSYVPRFLLLCAHTTTGPSIKVAPLFFRFPIYFPGGYFHFGALCARFCAPRSSFHFCWCCLFPIMRNTIYFCYVCVVWWLLFVCCLLLTLDVSAVVLQLVVCCFLLFVLDPEHTAVVLQLVFKLWEGLRGAIYFQRDLFHLGATYSEGPVGVIASNC